MDCSVPGAAPSLGKCELLVLRILPSPHLAGPTVPRGQDSSDAGESSAPGAGRGGAGRGGRGALWPLRTQIGHFTETPRAGSAPSDSEGQEPVGQQGALRTPGAEILAKEPLMLWSNYLGRSEPRATRHPLQPRNPSQASSLGLSPSASP